jgi:hypothetical protein
VLTQLWLPNKPTTSYTGPYGLPHSNGHYSQITELFHPYRNIETLARLIAEQFYIEKKKGN